MYSSPTVTETSLLPGKSVPIMFPLVRVSFKRGIAVQSWNNFFEHPDICEIIASVSPVYNDFNIVIAKATIVCVKFNCA